MKLVSIGRVTGTHGLDGVIKVHPSIEDIFIYDDIEYLMLARDMKVETSLAVTGMQEHGNLILVALDGVNSKESAMKLKGLQVVVPEDMLPSEEEGDIYWSRIEGSDVLDESGEKIGILHDYMESAAADVFIIKDGAESYMISNNEAHVLKIDPEKKEIVINREGLVSEDI